MIVAGTYVIAEAGVNHDGSVDDALRLVDAAADAGANCVKFQTFRAEALASERAQKADYQKRTTQAHETQRAMLQRLELPRDAYGGLLERARARGISLLSTPFDQESLDFLVGSLGLDRIKIGSGDMTNAPLLLHASRAQCPLVLSTGMSTLAEVEEALSVLAFGYADSEGRPSRARFSTAWADPNARKTLAAKVVLLHCTTEYPAAPSAVNLRAIDTLVAAFGLPVGFSDHTLGAEIALAAVARGAVMIEKHLTLDRNRPGPDHSASLEPSEFRRMVDAIRRVEVALGDGRKVPQQDEMKNMAIARKSLIAARHIRRGDVITPDAIALKRPGDGRPPIEYWSVVGTRAQRDFDPEDPL